MNDMICCGNDLFADKKYLDAEMKYRRHLFMEVYVGDGCMGVAENV